MAKAKETAPAKGTGRLDLQNLSERDKDFLTLQTKDVMQMYKVDKQAVYDRRHLLHKRIKEANTTLDAVLKKGATKVETPAKKVETPAKKAAPKKKKETPQQQKPAEKMEENKPEEQVQEPSREIVRYEKSIPVIMKPIEINFETFSIKLNGVPKKISVNPDTNAIEIDI